MGQFLSAYVNTVREVFSDVAVYTDPSGPGSSRNTFVVVGTRMPPAMLASLERRNGSGYLTGDHAPVENLTAPVFLRSID